MIQAKLAANALTRRYPEHEFVLAPLTTHGDRHPLMRLTDSPREGVFVKELEQALLDKEADLAVHSAKDLPTLPTPGLTLTAFLPRADARDALIARPPATLSELARGARIGTGSPRRAAQIAAVRPDLQAVEIRGNVDTRLRRLAEGAVDGLILAAAGLERLGRLGEAHQLLPFEVMLPAPGQGALALQAVEGSEAARLAAAYGIPAIATGDIFRHNIADKTPLGIEVKAIVDAGDYVPDSLTNALVTSRLGEEDARDGFLLDGYPRTLDQVSYLDELLASKGQTLDAVIRLVADQEEVVSRLRKRAIDQGRVDDSEAAIRHRQEVYARETTPLIDVYRDKGLLIEVDGLGEIDDVSARISEALAAREIAPVA